MLDLTDLQYFTTVAREGGVTRASEKLHRVQSNVTTRIRKLEDQLGLRLFLREGRRMVLTADGHKLLAYADRLIALAAEAESAMRQQEPGGVFRLGSMESTAAVRLPDLLNQLQVAYPDIEIELVTGNPVALGELVLAGEIEAALAAGAPRDERLDGVVAFEERVTVVSTAATLKPESPLLVLEKGCPHRARLEEWYAREGWQTGRLIEIGSYHAMFGCALAGMGAALVPESVISTFPDEARLVRHRLPGALGTLSTRLFWRRDMLSANTRALMGLLAAPAPLETGEHG
ncbi:MAG: LysR family transcriptional regulator [Silicimonas sp.]|jgi:DNA-binding transcriptional LysR family regulator|nr:LysR family transcriptional regulator [Silicimonas sp.]